MNGEICGYSEGESTIFELKFPISKYGDDAKVKMK